jgi:Protein kinase domain
VTGERIGPYQVIGELGRGGMGVVYAARHLELGREVALKLVLAEALGDDPEAGPRFQIEAETLARVRHPNVVAIYDMGWAGASPYLAMEFVRGEALDARLRREGPLEPRLAATLVRDVAGAVQHAHEAGVLHRDLKPANVLLGEDGRARLTDFGLARDAASERARLTQTGQMLGTPSFMAPEQAGGEEVGPSADVYGLGATLYALLCGVPPFGGTTLINILHQVLSKEPASLRSHRPDLDPDLEHVVLRCLAKEPADRYPSAQALAEDLDRWLRGEPVEAVARARPGRRPLLLLAALVLLVLGVAGVWIVRELREADLRSKREGELQDLREASDDRQDVAARPETADQRELAGLRAHPDEERAQLLEEWLTAHPESDSIPDGWRELRELWTRVPRRALLHPQVDEAHFVDADTVVTVDRAKVILWDLATGQALPAPSPSGRTNCVAVDRKHRRLALGRHAPAKDPAFAETWNLSGSDRAPSGPLSHESLTGSFFSLEFSPDGSRLAGTASRAVVFQEDQVVLSEAEDSVRDIAFLNDGRVLIARRQLLPRIGRVIEDQLVEEALVGLPRQGAVMYPEVAVDPSSGRVALVFSEEIIGPSRVLIASLVGNALADLEWFPPMDEEPIRGRLDSIHFMGGLLAMASKNANLAEVWSVSEARLLFRVPGERDCFHVELSPRGDALLVAIDDNEDSVVELWMLPERAR